MVHKFVIQFLTELLIVEILCLQAYLTFYVTDYFKISFTNLTLQTKVT